MANSGFMFGNKGRLTLGMFNQNQLEFYAAETDYPNHHYYVQENGALSSFMVELSNYINNVNLECPGPLLNTYFKFFTIITLKNILYPMVQSIAGHTNHDKITSSLSIIVDVVLQILNKKDEKDFTNGIIKESVTDFFAVLMDKAN